MKGESNHRIAIIESQTCTSTYMYVRSVHRIAIGAASSENESVASRVCHSLLRSCVAHGRFGSVRSSLAI